jgi:hypothetical protein
MAIAQVAAAGATRQSSDCPNEGWGNSHPLLLIGGVSATAHLQ